MGFFVPADQRHRFTTHYVPDPETGALELLDPPSRRGRGGEDDGWSPVDKGFRRHEPPCPLGPAPTAFEQRSVPFEAAW